MDRGAAVVVGSRVSGREPIMSIKSFVSFTFTCAAAAAFVLTTAGSGQALELCVKADRTDPTQPRVGSKIKLRSVCKEVKEVSVGTTDTLQKFETLDLGALQQLGQSVDGDGNSVFEIQSDVFKFKSPYPGTPAIGETESYCVGDDFPGEVGGSVECASASDCDGICATGATALIGTECSQNFECNSQGSSDGVCSSGSTCQEYALMTISGNDVYFAGFNVHIRSGSGATDGDTGSGPTTNGLGNLIVGYDESLGPEDKSGSHNLVVGPYHTYSAYGGLVAGGFNTVSGPHSSVSGGSGNTASGPVSSVSGGQNNITSGTNSSVSGGLSRTAANINDWAAGSLFEDQ